MKRYTERVLLNGVSNTLHRRVVECPFVHSIQISLILGIVRCHEAFVELLVLEFRKTSHRASFLNITRLRWLCHPSKHGVSNHTSFHGTRDNIKSQIPV